MKKSLCFLIVLSAAPLAAQIIGVKTYPVLSDENLFSYPSQFHAMGNLDIALVDELKEPLINPALLTSVNRSLVFLSPRRSSWSFERESNYASPASYLSTTIDRMSASNFVTQAGFINAKGAVAVSAVANYQRVNSSNRTEYTSTGSTSAPNETSFGATNVPLQLGAAAKVPWLDMSVGAQYSTVDLNGIDGIQFLYPGSKSLGVRGSITDMRMGVAGSLFNIGTYEALIGTSSLTTTQTALYDYGQPAVVNKDESQTKFVQLNYRLPLSHGLQVGLKALVNWKDLPQLPNYPIAGIPRDPGTATAYNVGLGASWRTSSSTLLALEYIFEPIQTDTWVIAQQDRDLGNGQIFPKGAREQENDYSFSNHIVRGGVEIAAEDWLLFRFGSEIHSYRYDYLNKNYMWNTEQTKSPQTSWAEVLMTGSATLTWGNVELSYLIESLQGRGLLEQQFVWFEKARAMVADFLLVPNDLLSVKPVPVLSHQVSVLYYLP